MGMAKANFRSTPASVPVNGNSPISDLNRPDTFSPSCVNVTLTVFVPCGDSMVMSQSPVRLICAAAGATRKGANSTGNRALLIENSPNQWSTVNSSQSRSTVTETVDDPSTCQL